MLEPAYITAAKQVVKEHQYTALDADTGAKVAENEPNAVILDATTANAMVKVWDALKPNQQKKLTEKPVSLYRYIDFAWKVVK